MDKSEFEQLMERYVTNQVSEEEKIKIEAWLDAIKTDDNTDLELSQEEEDRIFQRLTDKLSTIEEIKKLKPVRKIRPVQWVVRIAATLVIISLLSFAMWYYLWPHQSVPQTITAANGIGKVILGDGTIVWLQNNTTKINYSEKEGGGIRFCELVGEALFEVAKDPNRPFIVQCGNARITVVGTSFNIKSESGNYVLAVLTGKVSVSTSADQQGLFVLSDEKVTWGATGVIERVQLKTEEKSSLVSQTTYNMKFEKSLMLDIAKRIEEKFDVKVNTSNTNIFSCRITADFTDQSLTSTLQMITEVLDVQYSMNGSIVTLTGKGCQ